MTESSIDWIALSGAKPKGKRPYFFDDPAVDRVLAITMTVAQELAVARERIDTLERLLEARGLLPRSAIESYAPEPAAAHERSEWTRAYISRVLRIVQQEMEAIERGEFEYDMADKVAELSRDEEHGRDR